MPLYNSGKFIDEILNALLNQKTSYHYNVISVDDGSTDDTPKKLKLWENKYPNRLQVVRQKNKGIAGARNSGIEHSEGTYIGFVDHDDIVDENYVQNMLDVAYKESAGSVNCGIEIIDYYRGHHIYTDAGEYSVMDGTTDGDLTRLNGYIWGGIYNRELFRCLRFPEGYWFEDFFTHPFVYRQCKRVVNIPDVLYKKREHENNAAKILWSSSNPKSVEQLYLAEYLPVGNKLLGLKEDWQFFRCVLREVGGTLCVKTRGLDGKIKKQCFGRACKLISKYYRKEYLEHLNERERKYCKAFLKGDYFLWRVLVRY